METNHRSGEARGVKFYFQSLMLLEARVENGEWENEMEIENGKSDFSFFCFRFTIYSEEQIFFIDIHLLFKKHSGKNSRNEIN